ncbi:RHS repeat-associated core domain-containing protein [Pseudomonas xanthosomatis]|uniref:RHS repeat-associated core domain-containing protein n=1 Tax=Pseudomonas xanthosomatis TaxID=2842356 RepID=UPI001C3E0A92|nr:RHS repeat-associated core domain-containing protein [Pseudomonas xanthosomatis]QXH46360.1 RHS repeat-associated core domain-containing protein [Pseudomonas xanthosomatis]
MKKQAGTTHFFYQNGKLTTVSENGRPRTIFRADDRPLAEQHAGDAGNAGLLATDDKGSVLNVQNDESEDHVFSAYGHDPSTPLSGRLCGFNGEYPELISGYYLLGPGHHRPYATALMRFMSPDSWSPTGTGGYNAYAYCGGDPINRVDPSGHNWLTSFFKGAGNLLHLRNKKPRHPEPSATRLDTTVTASDKSPQKPLLPAYSQKPPEGHSSKEKATDLLRDEANRIQADSQRHLVLYNRKRLANLVKEHKGKKPTEINTNLERYRYEQAKQTAKQAYEIRKTPGVSYPPKYEE